LFPFDLKAFCAAMAMELRNPSRRLAVATRHLLPTCAAGTLTPGKVDHEPRRVLFTGGNVLICMVRKYPNVLFVCLDNLSVGSNIRNLDPIHDAPNFRFVNGTIVSESTVHSIMSEHSIDTVMHFAAQTHVDRSFHNPVIFTETNVTGTAILLKVSRDLHVQRFLHISTDEVYGENKTGVFDESAPFLPGNPYSASKAAADCLMRGYWSSFGNELPIVTVRPNNIYGPRQYPEKLIPKFVFRLSRKQVLPLHGGGSACRSFLYVEDAAEAFDVVLRKGTPGEAYNIGAEETSTKSVREVALSLLQLFGIDQSSSGEYLEIVGDRPKNDASYHVDSSMIRNLGWSPKVKFEDGLKHTVDWYLQHLRHWGDIEQALLPHN
jgi:dTDP-glucose 4,6-dehydratase